MFIEVIQCSSFCVKLGIQLFDAELTPNLASLKVMGIFPLIWDWCILKRSRKKISGIETELEVGGSLIFFFLIPFHADCGGHYLVSPILVCF